MHYRQVTVAMQEDGGRIKVVGKMSHEAFCPWLNDTSISVTLTRLRRHRKFEYQDGCFCFGPTRLVLARIDAASAVSAHSVAGSHKHHSLCKTFYRAEITDSHDYDVVPHPRVSLVARESGRVEFMREKLPQATGCLSTAAQYFYPDRSK
jgi:hypothetical protein